MKMDQVLSMVGIAAKAGKVVSGEFATENAVKSRKAYLVMIATDSSDNTKKKNHDMCNFYHVNCYEYGTKDTLGRCIGKEYRSSLTITDANLANVIQSKIKTATGQEQQN